jgi:hypothetical protein
MGVAMPTGPKPPIPAGIAKIVHEGTIFLKNWANIFYVLLGSSGPISAPDFLNLVTQMHGAYGTNLQNWKHVGSNLNTTRGIYVPTPGSEIVEEYTNIVPGATTSSTALPNNCAITGSWSIDAYYRGGHPRTYLDGGYDSQITNGADILPAEIAARETNFLAYASAVNGMTAGTITSVQLGTLSYARHNAWRPTPLFFRYQVVTVHPRLDSQRRRLGKEVV